MSNWPTYEVYHVASGSVVSIPTGSSVMAQCECDALNDVAREYRGTRHTSTVVYRMRQTPEPSAKLKTLESLRPYEEERPNPTQERDAVLKQYADVERAIRRGSRPSDGFGDAR